MTIVTSRYETLLKTETAKEEPQNGFAKFNNNDPMRRSMMERRDEKRPIVRRTSVSGNAHSNSYIPRRDSSASGRTVTGSSGYGLSRSRTTTAANQPPIPSQSGGNAMRKAAPNSQRASSGPAGAVGEDDFRKMFTTVPQCIITSDADATQQLANAQKILERTDEDWSKRQNALKLIRAVILKGGVDFESTVLKGLHNLEDALVASIKDLRSQVLREACITISYMAETYGGKLWRLLETLLVHLMPLAANSARIMATSAVTCDSFLTKYCHNPKLLQIITGQISSKSKEIRKHTLELTSGVMTHWDPSLYEKSLNSIVEVIKAGICDADPGARQMARVSYQLLEQNFPQDAQKLFNSLDPSRQKTLSGGASAASSTHSITSERGYTPYTSKLNPGRTGAMARSGAFFTGRSASLMDPNAAQSAAARRTGFGLSGTPARPPVGTNLAAGPARFAKPSIPARPGQNAAVGANAPGQLRVGTIGTAHFSRRSPISRSNQFDSASVKKAVDGSSGSGNSGAATNAARFVQATDDDELEFLKPFHPTAASKPKANLGGPFGANSSPHGNQGNPSPTSLNNQNIFYPTTPFQGVNDTAGLQNAIRACQSSNPNEKREGIRVLHNLLDSKKDLSHADVKRISETLIRLLSDTSIKLLSPTSDLLVVFVNAYHLQLGDWLLPLLGRLLQKLGTEMIPSTVNTIRHTLAAVRQAFDADAQFIAFCKYITDPIHTLATSVKGASLNYALDVLSMMSPGTPINRPEVRQAVNKLFQWKDEPKTASLKPSIEKFFCDLFAVNAADYSAMMATFDQTYRDYAHEVLTRRGGAVGNSSSKANGSIPGEASHLPSSPTSSNVTVRTPSHGAHSVMSHFGQSPNGAGNGTLANDSIGDFNAVFNRLRLSNTPPVVPNLNSSSGTMDGESVGATSNEQFVRNLVDEVNAFRKDDEEEQKRTLATLIQCVGDKSFDLDWTKFFEELVVISFNGYRSGIVGIQNLCLKLVDKLCEAQPARFQLIAETTLMNTLDVMQSENANLLAPSLDDTLKTLGRHLPRHSVIKIVLNIIDNIDDPRTTAILKMLNTMFDALNVKELEQLVPDVVPKISECCNSSKVEVRKSSIFALVTLILKMGQEKLEPYMVNIQGVQKVLLSHYLEKRQAGSRTGSKSNLTH
ncbi:hypothetical protein WR25_07727 [Diploscapter pachys]|uniref:TOG domain-containing protein n=1 Tax=Diploscapter pachys TaxID=2018661 RepID=A0A2A2KJC1_9BILA|nr:hypothetical protein WR25_07727 [Diploscapter pachys]